MIVLYVEVRDTFQKSLHPDLENATNCPSALQFILPVVYGSGGKFGDFDHACSLERSYCFSLCKFVSCLSTHLLCVLRL